MQTIIVTCPHCEELILIEEINCNIFRYGSMKLDGRQMDPHTPKELCDQLQGADLIYGCGKPFSLVKTDKNIYIAEICDYK